MLAGLAGLVAATGARAQGGDLLPETSYVDTLYTLSELSSSAEQGDHRAAYLLGTRYASGRGGVRDDSQAVRWFKRAADAELPEAQFNLGVMYAAGRGVPRDAAAAASWFRQAAEQGLPEAEHAIGTLYLTGGGVAKDPAAGARWLEKAAAQGYSASQYNLGVLYEYGTGVSRSLSTARKWYERADASGYAAASRRLASLDERVAAAKAGRKPDAAIAETKAPAKQRSKPVRIDWRDALAGLDPKSFTLQLVSYRTLDRARATVRRFELGDAARIFQNEVRGKTYFVVIYGAYASKEAAEKAKSRLPAKLRRARPIVRSVASLRAQLDKS